MTVINNIKTLAVGKGARALLVGRKHSPTILMTTGLVGVVAAGVLASRATLQLEPIVEDLELTTTLIKEVGKNSDVSGSEVKRDLTKAYVGSSLKIAKLYAPSVTLGAVSVVCILGAHNILSKRNVGLAAALKITETSFKQYRERVVAEHGAEKDREYKLNLRAQEVDGDEKGKKEVAMVFDPDLGVSGYARIFDKDNVNWDRRQDYNVMFLKTNQSYANDRLKAHGHLFLNEVYDMIGFEHSREGAVTGWIYDGNGDNFVDFGLFEFNNIRAGAIADGTEGHILLDFNVDGSIWDKI